MSNNLNLDENTMNNIKNMVDSGDFSGAISQISPEMLESVSKMLSNNNFNSSNNNASNNSNYNPNSNTSTNSQNNNNHNNSNISNNYSNSNSSSNSTNSSGFDFNNIDPATIMKLTSALGKMNDKNDPRANLLYSLKPYLRDGKKDKLDQYVNLLNITKMADIFKDNQKENNNG